jgi:hypothetical protein
MSAVTDRLTDENYRAIARIMLNVQRRRAERQAQAGTPDGQHGDDDRAPQGGDLSGETAPGSPPGAAARPHHRPAPKPCPG